MTTRRPEEAALGILGHVTLVLCFSGDVFATLHIQVFSAHHPRRRVACIRRAAPSSNTLSISYSHNGKYTEITNELSFKELLNYCRGKNYFVKIDIGNGFLPENQAELISYEKIKTFLSNNSDIIIILSGLDIPGDFNLYYQLTKYYNNLWLEVDPRSFGGMTPTDCFSQLFKSKGFVQNCWYRILIGSATPTLEISQIVRGFLEATDRIIPSQQCILRTWAFRNVNRLNSTNFKPTVDNQSELYSTVQEIEQKKIIENESEVIIAYKVKLRSYSITQLLYITDLIKDLFIKVKILITYKQV